ncbi:unnamed protein product [Coregonus sp. 'balchen']|nr:unnamed protein product [Coregonus sp. 'balchen']
MDNRAGLAACSSTPLLHLYRLAQPQLDRAQNMFRQAMRSPVILFHVVPASMKSQYEQLSQGELSPPCPRGERGNRESFSSSQASDPQAPQPGERGSLVVQGGMGLEHTPQRMSSRSRPHPIPIPSPKHQNHCPLPQRVPDHHFSTSLPHSGSNNVSSAPSPSLQRRVNGVDLNGRTQEEVVALLRVTPMGGTVSLLVVRQEDSYLPREVNREEEEEE